MWGEVQPVCVTFVTAIVMHVTSSGVESDFIVISTMSTQFASTSVLKRVQTGEQSKYADRRRFPRYRTNLPVRVRDRQQRTHVGHCFVIAEAGLGATLPETISVGSIVQLLLRFRASQHR